MKVFLTGCRGQLGQSLLLTRPRSISTDSLHCYPHDLTDFSSLSHSLSDHQPDIIINMAAFTNVDGAETEPEKAFAVNAEVPKHLAKFAATNDIRLVHISTDYVYGGSKTTPYQINDPTHPLGVYGASKLAGDEHILEQMSSHASIIRTAWVYSQFRKNFVLTMLNLMKNKESISVVDDQIGSPTWASSLARLVWNLIEKNQDVGLSHWTDQGVVSWFEFATAIQAEAFDLGILDKKIPINAVSSDEFNSVAARPSYSVLDCSKVCEAMKIKQTPWQSNLNTMLKQIVDHG